MKTRKEPDAGHPIAIEPCPKRIVARVGGRTVADSRDVLVLRESRYPPVWYFPRKDVDLSLLTRSVQTTYCPYKGDCSYYSISAGGPRGIDAVWTYEAPFPAVEPIREHLAFYPDRVDFLGEA